MARRGIDREKVVAAHEALRSAVDLLAEALPVAMADGHRGTVFSMRLQVSTLAALEARARRDGMTLKQVVCRALAARGVAVARADMEDSTPPRAA